MLSNNDFNNFNNKQIDLSNLNFIIKNIDNNRDINLIKKIIIKILVHISSNTTKNDINF